MESHPHLYTGDRSLLDWPMLEGQCTYGQWLRIVEEAEDFQYLTVKSGRMCRKSDIDAWLTSRYPWLSLADAHGIANEIERCNRTIYRRTEETIEWVHKRCEPTYEQYGLVV